MYEQRLGAARAAGMNRFADLVSAGVLVAFGSDAPVTTSARGRPCGPPSHPTNPGQALSARAAFAAHTRAGWRAIGAAGGRGPRPRRARPLRGLGRRRHRRAGPRRPGRGLVDRSAVRHARACRRLGPDLPLPTCLRTVVHGRTVFDSGDLDQA